MAALDLNGKYRLNVSRKSTKSLPEHDNENNNNSEFNFLRFNGYSIKNNFYNIIGPHLHYLHYVNYIIASGLFHFN